jgi:NAD(P)-dependent dehydrogenase (short-subunit alcohol dehydrogenase family)
VNTVSPRPVARPGAERIDPGTAAQTGVRLATRSVQPEEVANAIVYLCSPLASGINGAILNVNFGNYMPTG